MSGELLSSKAIVVEEEPVVRGIPPAPTSVAGAVGVTERRPVDSAVLCNSYEEFQQRFGGITQDSDLALAAMGFFENGGSQFWAVRTVHHTDVCRTPTTTAIRTFGFLATPGTPTPAFFVDVSEQLNTPSVIFAGKLIARVGLATNKPAEFVVLRISQDTRALEAELDAAGA